MADFGITTGITGSILMASFGREKWLLREMRYLTGQKVLSGFRKWLMVQV